MKLHHVALTVKDLSVSISFYQDLFGFEEIQRFRRDDMGATGVLLQGENILIELWQFDITQERAREELSYTGIKHIAFTHDDLNTLREIFINKGIECRPLREGKREVRTSFLLTPTAIR